MELLYLRVEGIIFVFEFGAVVVEVGVFLLQVLDVAESLFELVDGGVSSLYFADKFVDLLLELVFQLLHFFEMVLM